ncbi:CidB/LrgB family autolysis modulator [Capnocytophaga canimorsus]|uniref:CidB/LrgB family autolysis modulator n=1 Tax=Capnocytophaga canimorsus TaxID=28188 RepID=A0A250G0Q1_9FLAO|nr:LrgB family protein [Capnocytophaga canimorsus]ATA90970.1 CidB/LrgB family autolysis modulator [Capnocytophaga canimorsus]
MKAFLENPMWLLALTFMVYYAGQWLQKKYKSPVLSPILISMLVLIGYLLVFNISYEKYDKAGMFIAFWLKPSVVALGVPLYLQLSKIQKQLVPLLVSQFAGSLSGLLSVCLIAKGLGADKDIVLSLAPKSVTTPIAIEISNAIGGIPSLTAASVIITGILGSVLGWRFLVLFRIKSPMGKGIALGTASHGMGVMAALGVSEKHAVYASLGLIFNGIFTALLAPPVLYWLTPLLWS